MGWGGNPLSGRKKKRKREKVLVQQHTFKAKLNVNPYPHRHGGAVSVPRRSMGSLTMTSGLAESSPTVKRTLLSRAGKMRLTKGY